MKKSTILNLLGNEMRKKRKEHQLTQEQTAEILNVSCRWYQKIEAGYASPDFSLSCSLSKLFNINFADFCEEEFLHDYTKIAN